MSIPDDFTPLPIDNPTLYRRCREVGPSGSLDLTERLVRGADLRAITLPELYAPLARFEGVRFDGRQLCHAFLHSAVFIDCVLDGACLHKATLHNTRLVRCSLRQTVLRDVEMCGTSMYSCDLSGADLDQAAFHAEELVDCDLSTVHIGGGAVSADAQRGVRWPVGFTPR